MLRVPPPPEPPPPPAGLPDGPEVLLPDGGRPPPEAGGGLPGLALALDPEAGPALEDVLADGRLTWGMLVDAGLGGALAEVPDVAGPPVDGSPPEGA